MLLLFNETAATEIYTLSLHDALPILINSGIWFDKATCAWRTLKRGTVPASKRFCWSRNWLSRSETDSSCTPIRARSEEHTSELQSRQYLVCRLLLEKKK